MKKNVWVFGLIAGIIITTMMITTSILCYKRQDFEGNMLLGYATMIIAFSMIFVAIKSYRDRYLAGSITFAQAFKIGLFVTLVASTMYVVVWLVEYYLFIPDFMDRYTEHVLTQAKTKGASPEEYNETVKQMTQYKSFYKSPVMVVLLTYAEVLPIGIIVTLIASLILKRRQRVDTTVAAA